MLTVTVPLGRINNKVNERESNGEARQIPMTPTTDAAAAVVAADRQSTLLVALIMVCTQRPFWKGVTPLGSEQIGKQYCCVHCNLTCCTLNESHYKRRKSCNFSAQQIELARTSTAIWSCQSGDQLGKEQQAKTKLQSFTD